jgi:hypothetical protein
MKTSISALACVAVPLCILACASTAFAQGGTITIVKDTEPDSVTSFNFTGDLGAFSAAEGSPAIFSGLPDGTYSVTEQVTAGYELGSIFCSDPSGGTGVSPSTATAIIDLYEAESITCTFVNIEFAIVTIVKAAVPEGPQSFGFTGDLGAFSLTDDGSPANTQTFVDISPTTYSVYEDVVPGWDLTDIQCADPTGDTGVYLSSREVYFDLDPGEEVICTFTNVSQQQQEPGIPILSRTGVVVLVVLLAVAAVFMLGVARRV